MRLHNIIIANSTFPLSTMRPGKKEALIQAIFRKRLRIRQLAIQNRQVNIKSANVQRSRDSDGTAPLVLLSYNIIVAMKPGSKGKHNMSNKFEEQSQQWFITTRMKTRV